MASKIAQRIDEIRAIDAVEYLVKCEIGRCHPLNGNRQGEYAMDLVHPYRLNFYCRKWNCTNCNDNGNQRLSLARCNKRR